jgi:tryptophan-rich sensory protein
MDFDFLPPLEGETTTSRSIRMAILGTLSIAPSTIFLASLFFPTGPSDGACVPFRPAPSVYGFVWTILILLLTIFGIRLARADISNNSRYIQTLLTVLTITLCIAWMWRYHIDKTEGVTVFILLAGVLSALLPLALSTDVYNGALLMPLVVWVAFQTVVTSYETTC